MDDLARRLRSARYAAQVALDLGATPDEVRAEIERGIEEWLAERARIAAAAAPGRHRQAPQISGPIRDLLDAAGVRAEAA